MGGAAPPRPPPLARVASSTWEGVQGSPRPAAGLGARPSRGDRGRSPPMKGAKRALDRGPVGGEGCSPQKRHAKQLASPSADDGGSQEAADTAFAPAERGGSSEPAGLGPAVPPRRAPSFAAAREPSSRASSQLTDLCCAESADAASDEWPRGAAAPVAAAGGTPPRAAAAAPPPPRACPGAPRGPAALPPLPPRERAAAAAAAARAAAAAARAAAAAAGGALPPPRGGCDPALAEMAAAMRAREARGLGVDPDYLAARHGRAACGALALDAGMRRTVVGWLVEVAAEFGLAQDTLHLAVSLLDRFLSAARGVPCTQLQLAAVAAAAVAAKHEEEAPPPVAAFVCIADGCFGPRDLLRAEAALLGAVSYAVHAPTAHAYLGVARAAAALPPAAASLASYFVELAALEAAWLRRRPSTTALAAAALGALHCGERGALCALLAAGGPADGVPPAELAAAARELAALHRAADAGASAGAASPYWAVREKFSAPRWHGAGRVPPYARPPLHLLPLHLMQLAGGGGAPEAREAPRG